MHQIPFLLSHRVVLNYLRLCCEQVRVSATDFSLYHSLGMLTLSACVCSKTGLPDPDGVFRSMVPSETCNWDEFTATPVQALADTSFKKSLSGAQLLVWEALQLSLWRDMMLPALDNFHLSIIVTSITKLHHQASIPGCRIRAIALDCAHHMRINPTWCVLMTLVSFYCHFILLQIRITDPLG